MVLIGGNVVGTKLFSANTHIGDTTPAAVSPRQSPSLRVQAGVLADNGGPTETIALNVDPNNPAIGGAEPGVGDCD